MTQARDLADGKFDTDTLVVDAANNRVGVGTTSPTYDLSVTNTDGEWLYLERTGGAELKINASASAGFIGTTTNYPIALQVNSSEIARITSNGLTFNGDTAAANALDDYEEGTWTPAYSGTGGATTHTYTQQIGRYVKVGDIVHVYFALQTSATSGGSGSVVVTGLPYTISSASIFVAGSVGLASGFTTDDCPTGILGDYGNTRMFIYKTLSNSNQTNVAVGDLATGNGNEMYGSMSYRAN